MSRRRRGDGVTKRIRKKRWVKKECEMNPMTKHQQHPMKISSVHQAKKIRRRRRRKFRRNKRLESGEADP